MAIEEGIVIKLDSTAARVKTSKSFACKACASKIFCSPAESGQDMEVEAINKIGAQVGDRIKLLYETTSLLKACFLLYIMPVVCMLFGAIVGHWLSTKIGMNTNVTAAGSGLLCLILSFIIIRSKLNKLAEKEAYKPKIIKIL